MHRRIRTLGELILLAALVCLAGCNRQQQAPPTGVPEVTVVTVQPERLTLSSELPGRTNALLVAEIRPQVSGIVLKRLFEAQRFLRLMSQGAFHVIGQAQHHRFRACFLH